MVLFQTTSHCYLTSNPYLAHQVQQRGPPVAGGGRGAGVTQQGTNGRQNLSRPAKRGQGKLIVIMNKLMNVEAFGMECWQDLSRPAGTRGQGDSMQCKQPVGVDVGDVLNQRTHSFM
jgi:hypothetical protein